MKMSAPADKLGPLVLDYKSQPGTPRPSRAEDKDIEDWDGRDGMDGMVGQVVLMRKLDGNGESSSRKVLCIWIWIMDYGL